jgi:uncharacterized protein (TIGR02646 family)
MRHICKGKEPEKFSAWKAIACNTSNYHYRYLQNPEKRELHQELLQQQGYICCYCERQIELMNSHIEHLKPQKYCTNEETIDFTNLLACCQGEGETSPKPEHCGQKRGNKELKITPIDPACTQAFVFTQNGQIFASSDSATQEAATSTIDVLGLNVRKLQRIRERAIRQSLEGIELLTNAEKLTLIQFYETASATGHYEECCSAIAHVLKQNTTL